MSSISRSELRRMQMSVQPPEMTNSEARRQQLKKLSDERVSHWPNTLQATRKKKENWKKEKMAVEELSRQKIDREEAELQKRLRIESIRRANTILYEQTDKMKNLRSQQMYSDVLADRTEQIEEKKIMRKWERDREDSYNITLKQQLVEAEAREKSESEMRGKKHAEMAILIQEQIGECQQTVVDRLRSEKRDGELVKKKAEDDLQRDAELQAEKALKARLQAEEMQLANQKLKQLKLTLELEEEKEGEKRKSDLKKKEDMALARKKMEKLRFAEKQATRQKMIDRACEELNKKATSENVRLERQVEEARIKEDNELELRAQKRQRQREAIERSRHIQMELQEQRRKADVEENQRLALHYERKVKEMEYEEASEQVAKKEKNREVRATQEAQKMEKRQWLAASQEEQLKADSQKLAVMEEDDARFRTMAQGVLEEAKREGKNTYPIMKALTIKDITLLPASTGSRV
eukprot:CAMPEP_0182569442 /NCGR_PEP_ID=MMETSP1324-20130603/10067_1 /TAXON_ID=236786 /ORGANISM="Florenciella sp., Strain RCC1587" /LENGTH=465 /DNA_ID=CAMNT_0024783717 /DNA_START=97 /DNA_END=1494 /DNA_ORIENTATION=+